MVKVLQPWVLLRFKWINHNITKCTAARILLLKSQGTLQHKITLVGSTQNEHTKHEVMRVSLEN